MSEFVQDRDRIVGEVLSIYRPQYTAQDLAQAQRTWWQNIRPGGGLGLSYVGMSAFVSADIQRWEFELTDFQGRSLPSKIRIALDQRMPCPYYVFEHKKIQGLFIYDSRIASLFVLYNHDLQSMLETLSPRDK